MRFKMIMVSVAATLVGGTLACTGTVSAGCRGNNNCAAGEVCDSNARCVALCQSDSTCGVGRICSNFICIDGQRSDVPALDGVDGDADGFCPDAGGTHCIGTGLVVSGSHLEGATFELRDADGKMHALLIGTNASDTRVELTLPNVPPGVSLLVVSNAVGSVDQNVVLLQGPPGEPGQEGPQGPQGTQGLRGVQGAQGPQGPRGQQGEEGPRGLQGERGPRGEIGPSGSPDTPAEVLTKLRNVDGPGSGLDADHLRGLEPSDFLSAGGDTVEGNLHITGLLSAPTTNIAGQSNWVRPSAGNSWAVQVGVYAYCTRFPAFRYLERGGEGQTCDAKCADAESSGATCLGATSLGGAYGAPFGDYTCDDDAGGTSARLYCCCSW